MKASEQYRATLATLAERLEAIDLELQDAIDRNAINALAERRKLVGALKEFAKERWEITKADEVTERLPEKKTANHGNIQRAGEAPIIPVKGGG